MLIDILIPTITAVGTGAATFIFARKKYNAEVSTNELENVEKSIKIYREMVEDLSGKFEVLNEKFTIIKHENETLKLENTLLKQQVNDLTTQVNRLKND